MNLAHGTLILGTLGLVYGPLTTDHSAQITSAARQEKQVRELDLRDVASVAKITLLDAMRAAAQVQKGVIVEAGLEGEVTGKKREVFFEIMILDKADTLHEVKIDPASGTVLAKGTEDDRAEIKQFKAAIRNSEIGLASSIEKAMAIVKGKPLTAALQMEEEGPECEIVFINSRYLIEACVETRAGHLVDLELKKAEDDEADDEASRDEGDEEDHAGDSEEENDEDKGHEEDDDGDEDDEEEDEHKKG